MWPTVKELLNGAKIPNWAKLIVLGVLLGVQGTLVVLSQQSPVKDLQKGQEASIKAQNELKEEFKAFRDEMKNGYVSRLEFDVLKERVDANGRRLIALDDAFWAARHTR